MINGITIKNFKSHKNNKIDFVPGGVNVIVGESGAGKTAILKALKWVYRNQPSGDGFRSDWGGETEVSLHLNNGTVTRHKGKSGNYYKIDGGEPYKGLQRSNVPDDVVKTLNLSSVNLEEQLDSHFLLSSTAGQVAQYFNEIAHLDQIDLATRKIRGWITNLDRTVKGLRSDVKELDQKLEDFSYLDKAESEIEALEETEDTIKTLQTNYEWLSDMIDDAKVLKKRINKQRKVSKALPIIKEIEIESTRADEMQKEYDTVEELIEEVEIIGRQIEEQSQIAKALPIINSILDEVSKIKETKEKAEDLNKLIKEAQSVEKRKNRKTREVKQYIEEYNKHAQGQVCPLCDGEGKITKIE